MPAKRVPIARASLPKITPEIVDLWVRVIEIRATPGWQDDPALHRECYQKWGKLDQALGVMPFQFGPIDVPTTGPVHPGCNDIWGSWEGAQALRKALEAAAKERRS